MTRGRKPRGLRLFLVMALAPLLCVFPYLAGVNNPNENVRTYMTMALVERGTFRIDEYVSTFGWVNDMARVPSPGGGSHVYSVKAPAVSFLGVPVYWTLRQVAPLLHKKVASVGTAASKEERQEWFRTTTWALRLFVVQIPCALFLVWLERYLRRITSDEVLRLSAVTAACLGTNYVAYTNIFASHALCGVFAFLAFGLVERETSQFPGRPDARRKRIAFLAGLAAGMTVLLEYHALPMAVVLSLYALSAFWRPRTLIPFAVGGLLNAAALMLFQWRAFGNPLTPGHKMVESAEFAAQHAQGLFGIMMPTREALAGLSFDLGYGFFGTSPWMWLGLIAIPYGGLVFVRGPNRGHRRGAVLVVVLAMASLWFVSAGFAHWRGGWTVGPRYLAPAPPFFAFLGLVALESIAQHGPHWRTGARGVSSGLALASVLSIGSVGILYDTLPETYTRPFLQFVLPMTIAGFVPHHVGEWFGVDSIAFWYLVAGCLVGAGITAFFLRAGEGPRAHAVRVGVGLLTFGIAMAPAFTKSEGIAPDPNGLMASWEPAGRDRITRLRNEAERHGSRGPCLWYRLADLEQAVGLASQARRDEARADGAPRQQCRRSVLGL